MNDTDTPVALRRGRRGAQTIGSPEEPPRQPGSDGTLPVTVSDRAKAARRVSNEIGNFNTRLSARQIPGFEIRWVNDIEGRLENFLGRGWDHVTQGEQGIQQESTDPGTKVSRVVGSLASGEPMRAFLLKIPKEWYLEDQKKESAERGKTDQAIRRGLLNTNSKDKRYRPTEGISIKESDKPQ